MQPYEKYLKENSQKLRVDQTDAESILWQRINRDQLLEDFDLIDKSHF